MIYIHSDMTEIYACCRHNGTWSVCHRNQRFLFLDLSRCILQLLGLGASMTKIDIEIVLLFWITFDVAAFINSVVAICMIGYTHVAEYPGRFYFIYSSFSLVFGLPIRILIMQNMDIGYDLFPICYGCIPFILALTPCIQFKDGVR